MRNDSFPRKNPIGQRVTGGGVSYQIIGVVQKHQVADPRRGHSLCLFRSLAQSTEGDPSFLGYELVVRVAGNAGAITNAVRGQIHDLDSTMAVYNPETMQEHLRQALFLPRLAGTLFGIFGFIGLVSLPSAYTAS